MKWQTTERILELLQIILDLAWPIYALVMMSAAIKYLLS